MLLRSFSCTALFRSQAPSFLWCHHLPPSRQGHAAGAKSRGSRVARLCVRPGCRVHHLHSCPLGQSPSHPSPRAASEESRFRSGVDPEEAELGVVRAPHCVCGLQVLRSLAAVSHWACRATRTAHALQSVGGFLGVFRKMVHRFVTETECVFSNHGYSCFFVRVAGSLVSSGPTAVSCV